MSPRKPSLIVKISLSLGTEIVDCRIYNNRQMNVYTVKLKSVKFYSGTSTHTLRSASTCSAIQLLVETYT